mmetsp:Transcript_4520/g.6478  ORF Transcript_4520/g.6478 Transcript_4520/m.6478 type:complete len:187 (-) Transcript_4520:44-604(-)
MAIPCNAFYLMIPIGCVLTAFWARFNDSLVTMNCFTAEDEERASVRTKYVHFFLRKFQETASRLSESISSKDGNVIRTQPLADDVCNFQVRAVMTSGITRDEIESKLRGNLVLEGCSICLQGFDHLTPVTMVPCGHIYHLRCLREWATSHNTCPTCRADFDALANNEENLTNNDTTQPEPNNSTQE